jgi:hypothetical protein
MRFAHTLVGQADARFRRIDRLLKEEGQQGGKVRRFLIGTVADDNWQIVRSSLPAVWRTSLRRAREMD